MCEVKGRAMARVEQLASLELATASERACVAIWGDPARG